MTRLDGQEGDSLVKMEFNNLAEGNKFIKAMTEVLKLITQKCMNFINVQLIAENIEFFTKILPLEFKARQLPMPFLLTNFVDWKKKSCQKYCLINSSLFEIAK